MPTDPNLTSSTSLGKDHNGKLLDLGSFGDAFKLRPRLSLRLDELNAQIALGQIELARLTDNERPPTRSLRNVGSTESLRPNDGDNDAAFPDHDEQADGFPVNPFETPPKSNQSGALKRTSSSAAARAAAMTPPHSKDSPQPHPNPNALTRQPSHSTPTTPGRAGLRKRKTDSVASGGSNVPKYRTRSMILVYYDSAVQTAFEEMVKYVSGSRNAMRKGKMNAKMAAMRKAAELEVDEDNTDDDALDAMLKQTNSRAGTRIAVAAAAAAAAAASGKDRGRSSYVPGQTAALDADTDGAEIPMPALNFVSTRNMGRPRGQGATRVDGSGNLSTGMLGRYGMGRNSGSETPNIFDELDKGLEWCQGQCERAAHQSLRDGDCSDEIASIKKRLLEVKAASDREITRLKKEEAEAVPDTLALGIPKRDVPRPGKSRELRSPQMRKEVEPMNNLEVDTMEVDDEGVDDLDIPPLVFQRSRDAGRRY